MSRTRTGAPARAGAAPAGGRAAFAYELTALGLYLAFGVGLALVLVSVRAFLVAPRYGAGAAEALATPWVVVAIILAACYLAQRFVLKASPSSELSRGLAALVLILAVQFIAALPS
ncbi:MAG TPA: hypothetical protein VN228_12245 [Pyrinomonadaceae bacterium]|nr:hypothetical protein [Pyrinomonadaceae bacterium]